MGLMTLYDGETGRPLCVMDAGMITYYRTAAAGAYAATLLARRNSRSLAVIGTGGLGRMHLIATEKYFDLQNVYVYSIDAAQQQAFVQEFSPKYPAIRFHSCHTAREAVENADIISTATPAQKAVVLSAWVKPGTHINAFGCDMTGKQEIDPALFARAKLVVEKRGYCRRWRGHRKRCSQTRPAQMVFRRGDLRVCKIGGSTKASDRRSLCSCGNRV
jgi:ornithine cyclodeaminase/alanine dehydrogenase-like protein (mu-crystallin family)